MSKNFIEYTYLLPINLIAELNAELERIEFGASSRAILTTKRIILDKIAKLNK